MAFGEPVSVSCEAARPVRVLGWESAISAAHTQQDLSVQWKVDSLIDWIEEPICYGVFFTAPRQCEEKLNLVLYSESTPVLIASVEIDLFFIWFDWPKLHLFFVQKPQIASPSGLWTTLVPWWKEKSTSCSVRFRTLLLFSTSLWGGTEGRLKFITTPSLTLHLPRLSKYPLRSSSRQPKLKMEHSTGV